MDGEDVPEVGHDYCALGYAVPSVRVVFVQLVRQAYIDTISI